MDQRRATKVLLRP